MQHLTPVRIWFEGAAEMMKGKKEMAARMRGVRCMIAGRMKEDFAIEG
jgi:hypothetical protein